MDALSSFSSRREPDIMLIKHFRYIHNGGAIGRHWGRRPVSSNTGAHDNCRWPALRRVIFSFEKALFAHTPRAPTVFPSICSGYYCYCHCSTAAPVAKNIFRQFVMPRRSVLLAHIQEGAIQRPILPITSLFQRWPNKLICILICNRVTLWINLENICTLCTVCYNCVLGRKCIPARDRGYSLHFLEDSSLQARRHILRTGDLNDEKAPSSIVLRGLAVVLDWLNCSWKSWP